MIFSRLVDADFLDTESHFNRTSESKQYREHGEKLNPEKDLEYLFKYMERISKESSSDSDLNNLRNKLGLKNKKINLRTYLLSLSQ